MPQPFFFFSATFRNVIFFISASTLSVEYLQDLEGSAYGFPFPTKFEKECFYFALTLIKIEANVTGIFGFQTEEEDWKLIKFLSP